MRGGRRGGRRGGGGEKEGERRAGVCVRWLRSQHLSSDILEAMTPLRDALVHTGNTHT